MMGTANTLAVEKTLHPKIAKTLRLKPLHTETPSQSMRHFLNLLLAVVMTGATTAVADDKGKTTADVPSVKVDTSPSAKSADYVMDLKEAIREAKKSDKKVILYTGHIHHLKKRGATIPRDYFEKALLKASPALAARRSEFIVCELFEFTPMHDAKGNFTPEFHEMVKGWFGALHERYDIRFFTPTLNILDSSGSKLAGPFDNFAGFPEAVEAALRKIPSPSPPTGR